MKTLLKTVILFLGAVVLTGCSYTKPYPDMAKKNLTVYTNMKSKKNMTGVDVNLHIWKHMSEKDKVYLGTVGLEESPIMKLGIPEVHWIEFIVEIVKPGGQIKENHFIKPRSGYTYQVDIEYNDKYYNVEIYETDTSKNRTRKISNGD